MLASLIRRHFGPSHIQRLAASIALSIAAHVGILQIQIRAPSLVAFPTPSQKVVTLSVSLRADERLPLPRPTGNLHYQEEASAARDKFVELTELPAKIVRREFNPPIYIPAKELSRKPQPLADWDSISWKLPPQAKGSVAVTAYISETGVVDRLEFPDSISSEMQEWIRDVLFAGTAFSPGERSGIPVPTRITFEFALSPIRH